MLPVYFHESFSQVSLPNSPGCGIGAEGPEPLAGAHVVAADVAGHVVLRWPAPCRPAAPRRRRRRRERRSAGELEPIWPGLTTSRSRPSVRSTMPSLPKPGIGRPVFAFERDQLIAGRDQQDPLVVLAVGPVGQPAILRPHGALAALAFVEPVHPERLAGGGVDGHGVAPRAGREVQHAADHQRRDFPVVVGPRAEVLRLPSPGDLAAA